MYNLVSLNNLNEYFLDKSKRKQLGVFFYRINEYSDEIKAFIEEYYRKVKTTGIFIEDRIQNPNEDNLRYYEEMIGLEFKLEENFIQIVLKKWLPRLNEQQNQDLSKAMFNELTDMKEHGKNENILKNAFIKYMCWLYYRFQSILVKLGQEQIAKILYEGNISNHELNMISILASCGCDVVLLQYQGDDSYKKIDMDNKKSFAFIKTGLSGFPADFSVKALQNDLQEKEKLNALWGSANTFSFRTNVWLTGNILKDISMPFAQRGNEDRCYYNCFAKITGVENKTTYLNELHQFYEKLKSSNRVVVIEEKGLYPPSLDEINIIKRGNYNSYEVLIEDMVKNVVYSEDLPTQKILRVHFFNLLKEETKRPNTNFNRVLQRAVQYICWLNRYKTKLFKNWTPHSLATFIFLGVCENEIQAEFISFLSKLPIDILVLNPDLDKDCQLKDAYLFEKKYTYSLDIKVFPKENSEIKIGTVAYHAEQDLNTMMYNDSMGIYRNQQYEKASTITLQTMYEEIEILWNKNGQLRPNFNIIDNKIILPVIFAKISGIKDGNIKEYWADIKKLLVQDTYIISEVPFTLGTQANAINRYVTQFFKNGKIQKEIILNHKEYKYSYLREEMQMYILEKIQLLVDRKTIKGTFQKGMEYVIIGTLLSMEKELIRLIQKFDFTKNIPKIICIDTTEKIYSVEDSIILAFLNLVGFDILIFTPTGYQNMEKYFSSEIFEEHKVGEYLYDLKIPELKNTVLTQTTTSWKDKLFGRGVN